MKGSQGKSRERGTILGAVCLVGFLLCLTLSNAFGQAGGNASIYGTVTDSTGAVVPDVKVTATNVGTNGSWSTVSDASGNYVIPVLPIGQYKVNATHSGFASFEATGITLEVAQNTGVPIVMQVGTTTVSVNVTAGAPLVDTESAATKGTVERQFIDQLPLIDRNVSALETIEAGTGSSTAGGQLTVNGDRGGHNEFQLDGVTVNNPQFSQLQFSNLLIAVYPSPDAVQEFTMVRNGYEAQYGRMEGAQVIVATRSGTNQYHGLAFDYLRNNVLDAQSYFANAARQPITPYKRNIFGGTLGGPIKKDKLFFFGSYQGTRLVSSPLSTVENTVPTQAERQGNFSAISTPIINPATGTAFPGNMIPSGSLNALTQAAMSALVPLPNGPNGELIYAPAQDQDADQGVGKIDAILSSKDHLSGSVFIERQSSVAQQALPKFFDDTDLSYTTLTLNETHSFSPAVLNDFTAGVTYDGFTLLPNDLGGPYTWVGFGAKYVIPQGIPSIVGTVTGNLNITDVGGAPSKRPGQLLEFQDALHWVRGNHALIFGGSADLAKSWTSTSYRQSGGFSFNGFASGSPLADFILGMPNQFFQYQGAYLPHFGQDYAFYAQDTWRATRDLTLNVGLRWAPTFWETLSNGENSNFIPGEQSTVFPTAPRGLVYVGDPGIDGNREHAPSVDVLEPRIGIAWAPRGHSSWVVRAAFGEFHDSNTTFTVDNTLSWPYTLTSVIQTPPSMVNPWPGADPFPFTPTLPSSPLAVRQSLVAPVGQELGDFLETDLKVPTSLQWNFTVQRQLSRHQGIEVAYVGSHTYRIIADQDTNPPTYIPGECGATACSTEANINNRRPYGPNITQVLMNMPIGMSNYESLQVTYRHQVGYGVTLLANYTNEKTMSEGYHDYDQETSVWNPFNFRGTYAPAEYDIPQTLNVSYAWQLPWLANRHGFVGAVASGWTTSGNLTDYSGLPMSILSGKDNSVSGYGQDHADQIGTWQLPGGRSRGQQVASWFNTGAFQANALGTYGDTGRDFLRGPGGLYWDMSFFKDFRLTERMRLQYRLDGSNIFNHTVLTSVSNTQTASNFGSVTATGNPRILQMALRFLF